jgi:NTE family protein
MDAGSTYQYMQPKVTFNAIDFPVVRAVMASSCVPFAFTLVSIDRKYFTNPNDAERVHPVLVDGGIYDNQGIHKTRINCRDVLESKTPLMILLCCRVW